MTIETRPDGTLIISERVRYPGHGKCIGFLLKEAYQGYAEKHAINRFRKKIKSDGLEVIQ